MKTSGDFEKVIVVNNISPSDIHKQVHVFLFVFLPLVKLKQQEVIHFSSMKVGREVGGGGSRR